MDDGAKTSPIVVTGRGRSARDANTTSRSECEQRDLHAGRPPIEHLPRGDERREALVRVAGEPDHAGEQRRQERQRGEHDPRAGDLPRCQHDDAIAPSASSACGSTDSLASPSRQIDAPISSHRSLVVRNTNASPVRS